MFFATCNWVAGLKAPAEEGGVALRPPLHRPEWQVSSQGEEHPSFAFGFLSRTPRPPAPRGLPAQRQLRVQLQQPV